MPSLNAGYGLFEIILLASEDRCNEYYNSINKDQENLFLKSSQGAKDVMG
jgi:hypothetical protein